MRPHPPMFSRKIFQQLNLGLDRFVWLKYTKAPDVRGFSFSVYNQSSKLTVINRQPGSLFN